MTFTHCFYGLLACIAVIGCAIFAVQPLTVAHATRLNRNRCIPIYSDIREVVLQYRESTPYTSANWNGITTLAAKRAKDILATGGIVLTTGDTDTAPEHALRVTMVYSFANKTAFTIPLADDQLVTWVEFSKEIRAANGDVRIAADRSSPQFINAPNPDQQGIALALESAPFGLLENLACDVLKFSKQKICTDRRDWSKNRIVRVEEQCSQEPPEPGWLEQSIKQMESIERRTEKE